jgi:hypothetical protein
MEVNILTDRETFRCQQCEKVWTRKKFAGDPFDLIKHAKQEHGATCVRLIDARDIL